ncbi:MAG: hypothetical protein WD530_07375, partial [Vicingaceae bacterium]
STESGLLIMSTREMESQMGVMIEENQYKDYKSVSKVKFPHSYKQIVGPQTMDISVDEIEVNPKLDEALFKIEE